jgi:predicted PurR-regulated permease PerM
LPILYKYKCDDIKQKCYAQIMTYLFGRGKSRCMYPLILINYLTYIVKRSLELISISSGSDQDNHSNLRSIFVSLGRKNLKDAITNLRHNNSSVENLFSVFTSWANEQSYYWFKIFLELGLNLVFYFFFLFLDRRRGSRSSLFVPINKQLHRV